jgi:hypothetical protein
MNLRGTEADYLEYVALLLAERKLSFVMMARLVSNVSEMHDNALEHLGQVFDPDRSKVPDLSEPWDVFRTAHFEIQDGKRNLKWQTHANAEVHFQYYQWLQTLEGLSAEAVKAEFDAAVKDENEHSLRYYRREVDDLLKGYKDSFERQLRKAKDPEFLISEQVGWWTYVLMPDKAENVRPEWEREYNANLHFQKLRHESGNIRVGKGVPSVVRKPDLKRQHPQHEAEARQEYLDWLKELPQNSKPDMIAGQAFAFTADGKQIEKPTLQTIVEYFNEKGAEVQLFTKGNELALLSLGIDTLRNKDNTDLEADAREADPLELQALFGAKFTKAKESGNYKTQRTFAKAEGKRLLRQWADYADRFPIVGQWVEHLERMASETATDSIEQPERANTPPQRNEGGTGAEIEPERKAITFTDNATIEAIHEGLKAFFPERENDLLILLEGGTVEEPLHFAYNQRKLADVFDRAKCHGKLTDSKTEIARWMAANFTYHSRTGQKATPCNFHTIRDILSITPKGRFTPSERIPIKGLPALTPSERKGTEV